MSDLPSPPPEDPVEYGREDFEQLVTDILFALDRFTELRDGPDVDDAREAVMGELLSFEQMRSPDKSDPDDLEKRAKAEHDGHCTAPWNTATEEHKEAWRQCADSRDAVPVQRRPVKQPEVGDKRDVGGWLYWWNGDFWQVIEKIVEAEPKVEPINQDPSSLSGGGREGPD